MEDSDTYLAIREEGEKQQARKTVVLLAEERLGGPAEADRSKLEGITDLERLNRMIRQAVKAASWQEILETR